MVVAAAGGAERCRQGRGCGVAIQGPGGAYEVACGLRIWLAIASTVPSLTTPLTLTLTVAAGTFETIGFTQIYNMMEGDEDREAGDFGFDPLGLLTPATETQYKTAEMLHGRLAMLAFAGVVTQSALPGALGYGKEVFPYF